MTARRTVRRDVVCSTTHAVPLDGACPPSIAIARAEIDAGTTRYRIDGTAAAAERVDDLAFRLMMRVRGRREPTTSSSAARMRSRCARSGARTRSFAWSGR